MAPAQNNTPCRVIMGNIIATSYVAWIREVGHVSRIGYTWDMRRIRIREVLAKK